VRLFFLASWKLYVQSLKRQDLTANKPLGRRARNHSFVWLASRNCAAKHPVCGELPAPRVPIIGHSEVVESRLGPPSGGCRSQCDFNSCGVARKHQRRPCRSCSQHHAGGEHNIVTIGGILDQSRSVARCHLSVEVARAEHSLREQAE